MPSTVRYYQQRARLGYIASTAETWRQRWQFGVAWGSEFKLVSIPSSVRLQAQFTYIKKTKSFPLSGSPTNDVLQHLAHKQGLCFLTKEYNILRTCSQDGALQNHQNRINEISPFFGHISNSWSIKPYISHTWTRLASRLYKHSKSTLQTHWNTHPKLWRNRSSSVSIF